MSQTYVVRGARILGGDAADLAVVDGRIEEIGGGLDAGRRARRRGRRPRRAARPRRPAHPPARARPGGRRDRRDRHPGPRRSAASPPSTPWPTPTRWPTPPASSSRSGGSARWPATATCSRWARSRWASRASSSPSSARWPTRPPRSASSPTTATASSDAVLMRRALEYVKAFDGVVAQHAQEPRLTEGAQMNEGVLSGDARPPGLAGGRRGGDRRPRRPARRARRVAPARLPRLHRRHRRDPQAGQGSRGRRHRRGHPAPPAAHRRARHAPTTRSTRSTRRCARRPTSRRCARRSPTARSTPSPPTTRRTRSRTRTASGPPPPSGMLGLEQALAVVHRDHGRDRPARLGGRRRPDVVPAGAHRPARRPRPPARWRASPPTSCWSTRRHGSPSNPPAREQEPQHALRRA